MAALVFPTAAQALLQTPLNTFSPTSTPLTNTSNTNTYTYNTGLGVWTASGAGGGSSVTAATLAEAAAGTLNTVFSSPQTAVPKDASGMTGAALIPGGNDAARPATPVTGMIRYNSQGGTPATTVMEYWNGSAWTQTWGSGGGVSGTGVGAVGFMTSSTAAPNPGDIVGAGSLKFGAVAINAAVGFSATARVTANTFGYDPAGSWKAQGSGGGLGASSGATLYVRVA